MSFYLREVKKDTRQTSNITLGDNYTVTRRDTTEQIFSDMLDRMEWMMEEAKDRTFAIVSDENGQFHPLFQNNDNYIVTERGSTYERIM